METKKWYESKTMWAGLAVFGAGVAGMFGYSFGEADQSNLVELVTSAIGIGGGLLALYGRVKATKSVTK